MAEKKKGIVRFQNGEISFKNGNKNQQTKYNEETDGNSQEIPMYAKLFITLDLYLLQHRYITIKTV